MQNGSKAVKMVAPSAVAKIRKGGAGFPGSTVRRCRELGFGHAAEVAEHLLARGGNRLRAGWVFEPASISKIRAFLSPQIPRSARTLRFVYMPPSVM